MTITEIATPGVEVGTASSHTWTPAGGSADGDLLILAVVTGWSNLHDPAPSLTDPGSPWTQFHDVSFEQWVDFTGRLRRTRAWWRYHDTSDPAPTVTCSGMASGQNWGGLLWSIRGMSGPWQASDTSQRPSTSDPWNASDPGATATQMNVMVRAAANTATTDVWTPDGSWDFGRKREAASGASLYLAAREGPATAGTISLTAGGTASDVVTVATFSLTRPDGWSVGFLKF